jgi:hypothetical protein
MPRCRIVPTLRPIGYAVDQSSPSPVNIFSHPQDGDRGVIWMMPQNIRGATAYAIDVIVWSGYSELIEPLEASSRVRVSVSQADQKEEIT